MKIILSDFFCSKNISNQFPGLYSYHELTLEEKTIFNQLIEDSLNNIEVDGRNKNSWTKIDKNGKSIEIGTDKSEFFKTNKLYHYHGGSSDLSVEHLRYKKPYYISCVNKKIFIPENINGLVSNFLIHFIYNEDNIIILAVSKHNCWEIFYDLSQKINN